MRDGNEGWSRALGMKTMQFAGKRVAVIGAERTGRSAAAVLARLGARVVLSDQKAADDLGPSYEQIRDLPVTLRLGAAPEDALESAELVVPSPGVPRTAPVLRLAVELGIPVLSEVEIAYRIARCPILAVTGTNGKSTTAAWLDRMLREAGCRPHLAGNIAADDIQCTLIDAAERADEGDVIVAEVSSFQLEWVERFRPRVGILTNIRVDHLDRHGSLQEYAACKARLFRAQRPDDVAVVHATSAPARQIGVGLRSRVVWFDRGYCGQGDTARIQEQYLTVRYKEQTYRLLHVNELKLPGQHNQENALAASAAAIAFGATPDAVCAALREFEGLDHRMELVAEKAGVAFINSSMTTNVDAAVHVLAAVGRPVVMIAGGKPKREDYTPLGHAIARYAAHLVLIGTAAPLIETAASMAGFHDISRASTMEEAVQIAASVARPGDAVVLAPACPSQDMFTDFQERGRAFRHAVEKLLADEYGSWRADT